MADSPGGKDVRTVGPREGLGAGIVAIGVLSIVLPSVVDQLPSVVNGGAASFVFAGMMIVLGVVTILAGVLTFFVKD